MSASLFLLRTLLSLQTADQASRLRSVINHLFLIRIRSKLTYIYWFLQQIEQAVSGFAVPLPHHVSPAPPALLPAAMLAAKFVFV